MDDVLPSCLEELSNHYSNLEDELKKDHGFVTSYRSLRDEYEACCEMVSESCGFPDDYAEAFSEKMRVLANIQELATSYLATQKELGPRIPNKFSPKEKVPKKAESFKFGEIESRKPAWCFHRTDADANDFGFNLDSKQFDNMIVRLKSFETLTWKEILYKNRDDSNHFTEVEELSKSAKDRLRELNLDELDHLVQLRINKPTRLWGFFVGDDPHLHLLWYDPEHKVFASST